MGKKLRKIYAYIFSYKKFCTKKRNICASEYSITGFYQLPFKYKQKKAAHTAAFFISYVVDVLFYQLQGFVQLLVIADD